MSLAESNPFFASEAIVFALSSLSTGQTSICTTPRTQHRDLGDAFQHDRHPHNVGTSLTCVSAIAATRTIRLSNFGQTNLAKTKFGLDQTTFSISSSHQHRTNPDTGHVPEFGTTNGPRHDNFWPSATTKRSVAFKCRFFPSVSPFFVPPFIFVSPHVLLFLVGLLFHFLHVDLLWVKSSFASLSETSQVAAVPMDAAMSMW